MPWACLRKNTRSDQIWFLSQFSSSLSAAGLKSNAQSQHGLDLGYIYKSGPGLEMSEFSSHLELWQ